MCYPGPPVTRWGSPHGTKAFNSSDLVLQGPQHGFHERRSARQQEDTGGLCRPSQGDVLNLPSVVLQIGPGCGVNLRGIRVLFFFFFLKQGHVYLP